MASAIAIATEILRQKATGDVRFLGLYPFIFELEVPEEQVPGVGTNRFLYPLPLNPENYKLSEPFTVEESVGQGGSLYVEESGIVKRSIILSGTTGWAPRVFTGNTFALKARTPDKRSFSRQLKSPLLPDKFGQIRLSGHAHLMYLQDAVFRIYGDLKKDPATAEKTRMYFHNLKDNEHWLVVPKQFDLDRTNAKRTLYPYHIELLVLGPAEDSFPTAEGALLDRLNDALSMISSAVDLVTGAIDDITQLAADIGRFVKNIQVLIGQVQTLVAAAKDFLNGVTDLIETPFALLKSTRDLIDEATSIVADAEELRSTVINFPDTARQLLYQVGDAVDIMALHPECFATPAQLRLAAMADRQDLTKVVGEENLNALRDTAGPQTFEELNSLGTAPLPGDYYRARADRTAGLKGVLRSYPSAFQLTVSQGDTLANLAMRYLGDARLWKHIAVLNGMKPPFINDQAAAGVDLGDSQALSGVLGIGRKILIPSKARAPETRNALAVLGARLEAPAEEQLLGVDWKLEPVADGPNAQVDIPLDVDRGSTDGKKVRGLACLLQGVNVRLNTPRGHDVLYPLLGVEPVVGFAGTLERQAMAEFRLMRAVAADPRLSSVRNLEATPLAEAPDLIEVEMEAEVRGFAQGQGIRTTI